MFRPLDTDEIVRDPAVPEDDVDAVRAWLDRHEWEAVLVRDIRDRPRRAYRVAGPDKAPGALTEWRARRRRDGKDSDKQMKALNIRRDGFHGESNDTVINFFGERTKPLSATLGQGAQWALPSTLNVKSNMRDARAHHLSQELCRVHRRISKGA